MFKSGDFKSQEYLTKENISTLPTNPWKKVFGKLCNTETNKHKIEHNL